MTLAEKTTKLLQHSLIIKAAEKKAWKEMLPRMSEKDIQVLYNVLVDEVKAWKKEGISIVQNLAEEALLMPEEPQGASVSALKDRLAGKIEPAVNLEPQQTVPEPTTPFGKELMREVNTPELTAATGEGEASSASSDEEKFEPEFNEPEFSMPSPNKNAWMLSNKVVVPKAPLSVIRPKPMNVPKIRNRNPKHGLPDLSSIASLDDLANVEAAHLRQGPLADQQMLLKTKVLELAQENDMLPVSVLPIFEQSPLYQTYLKAGILMIERNQGDEKVNLDDLIGEIESTGEDALSQQEFEAVADLKKELETSAGI